MPERIARRGPYCRTDSSVLPTGASASGRLASQASRRRLAGHHSSRAWTAMMMFRLAGHHSPRAWTALMMFLVLMLCGPHSSERGPQAMPRVRCGNTVEPGGTRGKMTELLLSGQVLLSRPCRSRMLRTRPSLLKGIASSPSQRPGVMTRVRWAGTEQRIAPGPDSPGPENQ